MPSPHRRAALLLFAGLFLAYNSNGREVGTYDSQAAKFTAREIAVRHTLVLDRVIEQFPPLAERQAFARDRSGHVRSAYPVLPALLAGVPAIVAQATGLVDMDAPLAPSLIAVFTASALTAGAVALVFLALTRVVAVRPAGLTAIALGLGTGYWPLVSRTLWQHETVAFGLALTLWAWLRSPDDLRARDGVWGAIGLAMAGAARPQVAPLVALMAVWFAARAGVRRAVVPITILAAAGLAAVSTNVYWFGHWLGVTPALNPTYGAVIHDVPGVLSRAPWIGAAGLLVSPSRGLLVFSPIWLVAARGWPTSALDRGFGLAWLAAAAAVQFVVYSWYAVWWGGHTFGPRYALDVLVPLTPLLGLGWARVLGVRGGRWLAIMLLAVAIGVSARGAFVYPNDGWNTDPDDVDRDHGRLWDVIDSQIPRAFRQPMSPQNFDLLTLAAIRRPEE